MAIDLVSLVSQFLTPQLIGQIGSAAGINSTIAQKLVSAAIPSVIAALSGGAAAPGGAQKISDLVSNADPALLSKLTGALGSGQGAMLGAGASALSGIIGGQSLSSLAGALGQFSGASPAAAQTAVGAVSHALVGVLGQQDPSAWSDAAGVSALFAGQKGAILSALPSGLGNLLSSSGLMAGIGGLGAAAAGAAGSAGSSASSAMSSAASGAASSANSAMNQARSASATTGFPTWAIVLIVLIVLALAYWFFTKKDEPKPAASGAQTIEFALARATALLG